MSQIADKRSFIIVLIMLLAIMSACGSDPNSQTTLNPETGLHPIGWLPAGHSRAAAADVDGCAACHGVDYNGGISGISCRGCHLNTTGVPSCRTCHGFPPATGKHIEHRPAVECLQCHPNTVGTPNHANAVVNLDLTAFNAKTGGPAVFADPNCSGVSCHGANTQDWVNGAPINVNTQCTACHAYGTAQYNSFNSGRHNLHVNTEGIGCTQCHDTNKLATNHFRYLKTPVMEGPASLTLLNSTQYNGRTCDPACHGRETW